MPTCFARMPTVSGLGNMWRLSGPFTACDDVGGNARRCRYDELSKFTISHLSVIGRKVLLTINVAIKNNTTERTYTIEQWPESSGMHKSLLMDPFIALMTWLLVRGSNVGPLFCDYKMTKGGLVLQTSFPIIPSKFIALMRDRLQRCGVGKEDVKAYCTHSIKRRAVQSYRNIGRTDFQVMDHIGIVGEGAYWKYAGLHRLDTPKQLSQFPNSEDLIRHAKELVVESEVIYNEDALKNWLSDVWGVPIEIQEEFTAAVPDSDNFE